MGYDKKTYTLSLSSRDKISGTNNNATFNINWDTFLPRKYDTYKVIFNFQTIQGVYMDATYNLIPTTFSTAKIYANFSTANYSYDTSLNGPSTCLGLIERDVQTVTTTSNRLSSFYYQNVAKTIGRPVINALTITIYNNSLVNTLLYDTNGGGTALLGDMSHWNMIIEFIPIDK